MRYRKFWERCIAFILMVTVSVTSVDLTAFAVGTEISLQEQEGTDTRENESIVTDENGSVEEEPVILSEIEEKRTENSKTFLRSDGARVVAMYPVPVHAETDDGNWEEISYELEMETGGTDYATTEQAGKGERIKLSGKYKEKRAVEVGSTDFPISWGIEGAGRSAVVLEEGSSGEESSIGPDLQIRGYASQKVTYENIFEDVDVRYCMNGNGIKEDIILKSADAGNVFRFVYDIGDLDVACADERTIFLKDGGKTVYRITAPYMTDAHGAMSTGITLEMEKSGEKEITVTLTADAQWLAEKERSYPVTIDPAVVTETDSDAIDSTFITSDLPSANYSEKFELLVGKESSEYGNCRSLVRIELPELGAGDMIVDADLNLTLYKTDFYVSTTPDLQINAYRITEDWDKSTVTWNTKPSYDSTVLDYRYIGRSDISDGEYLKTFDITEAVKAWYEGEASNYGIMIRSYNESGTYAETGVKGYFWPERYNDEEGLYPYMVLTYRNNKGLEDYWTYTAVGAGTAGTAYINDYTGNLVFIHDDVSTSGGLMPVSLQHVYNSYMMNKRFSGSHPGAGRGWKLSIQQTILGSAEYGLSGKSLETFPYAYEDGDGTVHFFYKKTEDGTTEYLDEDGLGLKLEIDGSTKTITDKEKNVMTFGPKGNLTSIADARGNTAVVTYKEVEDGKSQITKITDGAGHVIRLEEYNTTLYNLMTVTDPSGRVITYSYTVYDEDSGNRSVSKVTYPDGTCSSYEYDAEGALVRAVSADGSSLKFVYTSSAKGKRISKVAEYGTDGSIGQTVTFDRSEMNTTVLRTSGSDDVFSTGDDLLTTFRFDNYGRTIATNVKTADGSVYYGGTSASYTAGAADTDGSNIGQLNRVAQSSYNAKAVRNLLKNHSAEEDTGWNDSYWLDSGSVYTASVTDSHKCFGERSLSITGESAGEDGGAAYNQAVSTELAVPGKTYTFSGYIKTANVVKSNTADAGYGACLAVRFRDSSGNYTRKYSGYITGTTATGYEDGWRRETLTFTVPESAEEVRVYALLRNATGTAYFDGLQLEKSSAANPYNMLYNSSFETASGSTPSGWTLKNAGTGDGCSTAHYHNGSLSLKLEGEAAVNKYAYQETAVSGTEEDIYIVSGWAWAEALPDAEDITRSFDIFIRVFYSDGTSVFKSRQADFNRDGNGWQRAAMAFDLDDGDDENERTPVKIRTGVRYYKQENAAYFDSMQLVKDTADSYTYDKEGNLISARENGEQNSSFGYDDDNNLISVKDAENNLYEYEYNDYGQVKQASAPMGQTVDYAYTAKGTLHHTVITSEDGEWKIRSGSVYNEEEDGIAPYAYVVQDWDQNGCITYYDVDVESGLTGSVTTPDNVTTTYTYNTENDLLTKTESGNMSVSYGYDESGTKLTTVTHNGFDYGFTYSICGNPKKISAAGQTLAVNTYTAKNGKLKQTEYGNGTVVTYTYNTAGSLSRETVDGTTAGTWTYNASQQVAAYKDYESGRKHTYSYDVTGRLLETKVTDTSVTDTAQDARLFTALYRYDSMDRLERTRIYGESKSPYAIYSYNTNGQNLSAEFSTGKEMTYSYDRLGRLLGKETDTSTPILYNYSYHLSGRNSGDETVYKTTLLKNELLGDSGYRYEYDKMGNIVKISEGTRPSGSTNSLTGLVEKISYAYDSHGQLTRENDLDAGTTSVYSYDNGGNITSRKIYDYTTEDDLSGKTYTEIRYAYDSTWKDKLVSYNGETIEYDGIGNPTSYLGKELSWTGRSLDSLTQDGTKISYAYDADGLRTKKKTGTNETQYYYSNGLLSYEKRSDCELYYTYDADGQIAFINYVKNGTSYIYYPMINSRGDIEGLYNSKGVLKVRYTYDAWGRLLETEDTTNTGIGTINPFRYRGYYYDVETGFYYVSSRYYDPEIGRFISADEYITTGQGVLSYNMYAYCLNNPVNRSDPTGNNSSLAQMWTSTMWWLCAVDSVFPLGDMIYLGGALLLGVAAINSYSSTTITVPNTTTYKPTTDSKAKEEEKVNAVTKPNPSSTPIYRYGGTNPGNLVPREKDVLSGTGLSFSTVSRPGAAMTTMEAVNSTGVLIAIKDGPTHVSVYPVGTTMEGWRNAGTGSIWTMTLKSIVIKWTP